jgi:hypothetical protein
MEHVPEWERLADALKRVVATGIAEGQAQVAICGAISDRSITVRLFVGRIERADIFLLEGWEREVPPSRTPRDFDLWQQALTGLPPRSRTLMIPSHIVPQDFDWTNSNPLKPLRDAQEGVSAMFQDWRRDRIELFSADVTKVVIAPQTGAHRSRKTRPAAKERAPRKASKREQARIVLNELYSGGIPGQNEEPDAVLVKKVATLLAKKFDKAFVVSADTILRAAGRRNG